MSDATANRMLLSPGDLLEGKYRIEHKLAEGGMGAVYHATQQPLGRDVAVKVLKSFDETEAERDNRFKRFFREAAICSRLNHPNTVMIFDYGQLSSGDGTFLVMEFLRGYSLRDLLNKHGVLTTSLALHIAIQIASSLADAHAASVVHRDLKPPNIMLVERGGDPYFVKVVDFGLVKELNRGDETGELTAENTLIGSPMYMAPERFLYHSADSPAVDTYALGIMLYEMLCGRPPFIRESDSTIHRVMMQHIQEEPPPMRAFRPDLRLPDGLEQLIIRCLAKDPAQRINSMETLVRLLKSCSQGQPVEVPALQPEARPAMKESTSDQMVAQDTQNTVRLQTGEEPRPALPSLMTSVPQIDPAAHPSQQFAAPQQYASPSQQFAMPTAPSESSGSPVKLVGGLMALVVMVIIGLVVFNVMRGPAMTPLVVETTPPGAQVFIDGNVVGVTPVKIELPLEQSATLRISKEGFETFERGISPSQDAVVIALPLVEVAAKDVDEAKPSQPVAEARESVRALGCVNAFGNFCETTSVDTVLPCLVSHFDELDESCQKGLRTAKKADGADPALAGVPDVASANTPIKPTKKTVTKPKDPNPTTPTIKLGR